MSDDDYGQGKTAESESLDSDLMLGGCAVAVLVIFAIGFAAFFVTLWLT